MLILVVIDCDVNGTVAECVISQELVLEQTTIRTQFAAYTQNLTLAATTLYPLSVAQPISDSSGLRSVYTQNGNPPLPTPITRQSSLSSATRSTRRSSSTSRTSSSPTSRSSSSRSLESAAGPVLPPTNSLNLRQLNQGH